MGLAIEREEAEQQPEQYAGCWPDNWQVYELFISLSTQWNVGQSSVIGLRYEVVIPTMKLLGISKKARADIFQDLRIMENEALQVFNDKDGR